MGRSRIYRTTGWAMAIAYLSLLAHVFVPHHHHGIGTAFLDHKACPHEPYSCTEYGEDRDQVPAPKPAGDCETLKHTWLKTSTSDDYRTKPIISFIWADTPVIGYTLEPATTSGKRISIPWLSGQSLSRHKTPAGLRGPPLFNS